jgi:hypothetical protein
VIVTLCKASVWLPHCCSPTPSTAVIMVFAVDHACHDAVQVMDIDRKCKVLKKRKASMLKQ